MRTDETTAAALSVLEKPRRAGAQPTADPFLDEVIALLPALRAFGLSLCGNASRVDDLTQDTVIKAHLHRAQFRTETNLRSWLFTILRNCYFSEQRRRRFEIEDPDCTHAARLYVDPIHDVSLQLNEVDRAMQRLPLAQRETLLLVCADGVPYAEAADVFGVAIGTIKSRIARARDELCRWRGRTLPPLGNPLWTRLALLYATKQGHGHRLPCVAGGPRTVCRNLRFVQKTFTAAVSRGATRRRACAGIS